MEVILLAALSVDGFIAQSEKQNSTEWTSGADAKWFAKKSKEIGICIMGRTTFETIGRPLPGRQIIEMSMTGYPIESLSVGEMGSVITTNSSPKAIIRHLKSLNLQSVAVCGGSSIYGQFLSQGLVTRLFLTIEPVMFGQGVPLLHQPVQISLKPVGEQALSTQVVVREYEVV